jgi:hypothetical protein
MGGYFRKTMGFSHFPALSDLGDGLFVQHVTTVITDEFVNLPAIVNVRQAGRMAPIFNSLSPDERWRRFASTDPNP